MKKEYYGDETRWFIGVVKDIQDPLELGRVRVRIFGVHPDKTSDAEDDDLPWAQVVVPITEGGSSGIGTNIGIKLQSQVYGIFLDGKDSQLPLVLGSIPKYEKPALFNYLNNSSAIPDQLQNNRVSSVSQGTIAAEINENNWENPEVVDEKYLVENYKREDMILTFTHKKKDKYTQLFSKLKKWYIEESDTPLNLSTLIMNLAQSNP